MIVHPPHAPVGLQSHCAKDSTTRCDFLCLRKALSQITKGIYIVDYFDCSDTWPSHMLYRILVRNSFYYCRRNLQFYSPSTIRTCQWETCYYPWSSPINWVTLSIAISEPVPEASSSLDIMSCMLYQWTFMFCIISRLTCEGKGIALHLKMLALRCISASSTGSRWFLSMWFLFM